MVRLPYVIEKNYNRIELHFNYLMTPSLNNNIRANIINYFNNICYNKLLESKFKLYGEPYRYIYIRDRITYF